MNFDRIKRIRQENELTQQQMAELLEVKRAAYSLWEINKNVIPLIKLNDLSNKFKISIDYIVGISNDKNTNIEIKNLDKREIGKRIKKTRKELGLTQEKLADIFNTTHSAISAYENGKTLIPTIFLIEFAKLSKKSLDWFCDKKKDC